MDCVILAQSDTTAGFLSLDKQRLNEIKNRDKNKSVIMTVDTLEKLKRHTRIPSIHKNRIRKQAKSTFIYNQNNKAIRVIKDRFHSKCLESFEYLYSTSANKHGDRFSLDFAISCSDIIVLDKRGLGELESSKIYKINNHKIKRLR